MVPGAADGTVLLWPRHGRNTLGVAGPRGQAFLLQRRYRNRLTATPFPLLASRPCRVPTGLPFPRFPRSCCHFRPCAFHTRLSSLPRALKSHVIAVQVHVNLKSKDFPSQVIIKWSARHVRHAGLSFAVQNAVPWGPLCCFAAAVCLRRPSLTPETTPQANPHVVATVQQEAGPSPLDPSRWVRWPLAPSQVLISVLKRGSPLLKSSLAISEASRTRSATRARQSFGQGPVPNAPSSSRNPFLKTNNNNRNSNGQN